jgi:hypothetical protein
MDIDTKVKEYISGCDISQDYNDYKSNISNDIYNKVITSNRVLGRILFDTSLVYGIKSLAEGDGNNAGLAAMIGAGFFLVDLGLKYSRKYVINYKQHRTNSL